MHSREINKQSQLTCTLRKWISRFSQSRVANIFMREGTPVYTMPALPSYFANFASFNICLPLIDFISRQRETYFLCRSMSSQFPSPLLLHLPIYFPYLSCIRPIVSCFHSGNRRIFLSLQDSLSHRTYKYFSFTAVPSSDDRNKTSSTRT